MRHMVRYRSVPILLVASLVTSSCSSCRQSEPSGERARVQGEPGAGQARSVPPLLAPNAPVALSPEEIVHRSELLRRTLPRGRYSIADAADALGAGVDPAFTFVRDRIGFEPYAGALRGSAGTLAHGAGNAADRALLLSDLLRRKGVRSRLVTGRLDVARTQQLLAQVFASGTPGTEEKEFAPPPDAFSFDPFLARVHARAVRDYAAIRAALGSRVPGRATVRHEEILGEITSHVWVQAEVDGRWIDLDPSFGDGTPGQAFAAPDQTFDALPADIRQQITFRIVADMLSGGATERRVLLNVPFDTATVADRQIFLFHVPGTGKSGLVGGIESGIAGGDTWAPVLWVGGEVYTGDPLSFGEVESTRVAGPPRGGLGALFGTGGALASARPVFVTEWLELEIRVPGRPTEVIRRPLVDRAGEAWRRAGTPSFATLKPLARDGEGIVDVRRLHNVWFSVGRHDLADFGEAAEGLARFAQGVGSAMPPADLPFEQAVWPFALHNFSYFLLSDHAILPALNRGDRHRLFPDSPRIFIVSAGPRHVKGVGRFTIEYELARNAIRAVSRGAEAERGAFERKIWFGALEGALEHELGERYGAGGHLRVRATASTSAALREDGATLLAPEDAARADRLFADAESAALAQRQLRDGALLIVPLGVLRGGTAAWWSVDGGASDTRAVLGGAGGMITNFDPWGPRPGQVSPSGAGWDLKGNRYGSRFGVQRTERATAPHEYFMMIATISIAVVVSAAVLVAFYREVIVPTMAGQVVSTLETGVAADRRR